MHRVRARIQRGLGRQGDTPDGAPIAPDHLLHSSERALVVHASVQEAAVARLRLGGAVHGATHHVGVEPVDGDRDRIEVDEARRVAAPGVLRHEAVHVEAGPRLDGLAQHHVDLALRALLQDEHLGQHDLFQRDSPVRERVLGCGEDELEVASRRHHRNVEDAAVGEVGRIVDTERRLVGRAGQRRRAQAAVEQRVEARLPGRPPGARVQVHPVPLALEGVRRELDLGRGSAVDRLPVRLATGRPQASRARRPSARRPPGPSGVTGGAPSGPLRSRRSRRAAWAAGRSPGTGRCRRRAGSRRHLRSARSRARGRPSSRASPNAAVSTSPVTVDTNGTAGSRKVMDDATAASSSTTGSIRGEWKACETFRGRWAMPAASSDPTTVPMATASPEMTVLAGAFTAATPTVSQKGATSSRTRASSAKTATIAPPSGSSPMSRPRAAMSRQRVVEVEDAGHRRRDVLADGVPRHRARFDPPGPPELRQAVLDGEERGLRVGRVVHQLSDVGVVAVEHVQQRRREHAVEVVGARVHRGPEHGLAPVQPGAHPGVLRALAGEHEGHLRPT